MKITCPKCNAGGSIPDHEIPEAGRYISCPHCHEGFTITRPRSGSDVYLVDTCPACSFSTFGEETFSTCPKCNISIKSYVERQRQEQRLKLSQAQPVRNQGSAEAALPQPAASTAAASDAAPVADFIESLHPVNLIGMGVAAAALIILGIGLWGVIGFDGAKIQALLMEEREDKVSGLSVFLHHGLQHWVLLLYGVIALAVSLLFMKRRKTGLKAMSLLLRTTIVIVPLSYVIGFINWVLAPISHTISGYLIEIFNIIFMGALAGAPLYLLERYLHERKITSVVNR